MSRTLVCPVCGENFSDEDYCPQHGTRLVFSVAADLAAEVEMTEGSVAADPVAPVADPVASRAITGGEEPAGDDARVARLAAFMSRAGLRAAVGKTKAPAKEQAAPKSPAPRDVSPLPDDAIQKGWKVVGDLRSRGGGDVWPIAMETADGLVTGNFSRYRTGALTTETTYRRLAMVAGAQVARLWGHGTVDFGGARADYDLTSLPRSGVSLDEWLLASPPSEQRALALLPALVRLLRDLSAAGLRPIVFEPAQLLRTDDGELCLACVGAMAVLDTSVVVSYHPEFARSSLLHHDWAAPELVLQTVLSANAAVFSLGQVLAQATWGQPLSHAELLAGAVPFRAMDDSRLARALMGCLWPRHSGRWGLDELETLVDGSSTDELPSVAAWASLVPGAASTAFGFAGRSFWRMEDLLAVATQPQHWSEAIGRVQAVLEWAEATPWVGQARLMREALAAGRSPDWVLVRLARGVRPDAPMTWRDLALSDDDADASLAGLAQRVLRGHADDAEVIENLFAADLRGAFASTQSSS